MIHELNNEIVINKFIYCTKHLKFTNQMIQYFFITYIYLFQLGKNLELERGM